MMLKAELRLAAGLSPSFFLKKLELVRPLPEASSMVYAQ